MPFTWTYPSPLDPNQPSLIGGKLRNVIPSLAVYFSELQDAVDTLRAGLEQVAYPWGISYANVGDTLEFSHYTVLITTINQLIIDYGYTSVVDILGHGWTDLDYSQYNHSKREAQWEQIQEFRDVLDAIEFQRWEESFDTTLPDLYIDENLLESSDEFSFIETSIFPSGNIIGDASITQYKDGYASSLRHTHTRNYTDSPQAMVTFEESSILQSNNNLHVELSSKITCSDYGYSTHRVFLDDHDARIYLEMAGLTPSPVINADSIFSFTGSLTHVWTPDWHSGGASLRSPVQEFYIELLCANMKLRYDVDLGRGYFSPYFDGEWGHIYISQGEFSNFNRNIEEDYQATFGASAIGSAVVNIKIFVEVGANDKYILHELSYDFSFTIDNFKIEPIN